MSDSANNPLPPRDASGKFVAKDTPPEDLIKKEATIKTPGSKTDPSLEAPLVSFSINNPFKKILYWLNDIRKKQTTTFDLKIKIPLIALPIFLLMLGGAFQYVFNMGKQSEKQEVIVKPTPTPVVIIKPQEEVLVSKAGIIKATYLPKPLLTPTIIPTTDEQTATPSPTLTPVPTVEESPLRYILTSNSQIIFLLPSSNISLKNYLNKRVLINGLFNKSTNSMKIEKEGDIELLR